MDSWIMKIASTGLKAELEAIFFCLYRKIEFSRKVA